MIVTDRLLLRMPSVSDAADVLVMSRDPETIRWNPAQTVVDLDTAVAWCERAGDWSTGDHVTLSVVDVRTGRYLGNVSLYSIDVEQADAEVGYRVAPWARGRRYAAEALSGVSAWAFRNLSLVRVELAHAVANVPSCAVALRAGYPLEGLTRQSYVYGDGVRHDEHLHARLCTDPPP